MLYRLTDEGVIPFPLEKYIDCGNQIEHRPGPTTPAKLQLAKRAPVVPIKPSQPHLLSRLWRWMR